MKIKWKYMFALPLVAAALTACGSHPKYYGECHVYVGEGKEYRATIDLYGSSAATSLEGHKRFGQACAAVSTVDK